MHAQVSCCVVGRSRGYYKEYVRSETGLTVGHLLAAAEKLVEEHEFCPFAEPSLHQSDGTVKPRVTFDTVIQHQADDPVVVKRRQEAKNARE